MPDFNDQGYNSDPEEVFLIKWRVSYYLQSSWKRRSVMEKFDLLGNTPKRKTRRYVQAQEALFGIKWKRIVDKQRTEIHCQIHPNGLYAWDETAEDGHTPT